MSSSAFESAQCAAQAHVFSPDEAAGQHAALKLAGTQGGSAAASAIVPQPASQVVELDQAPLMQLPAEVLLLVLCRLDARNLARLAATCSELYREPTSVEEALRQRAAALGRDCPDRLPQRFSSWASHLAWLECRRDEAWAPVAAGGSSSFFVAKGLMSCGVEGEGRRGLLGQGEIEGGGRVVPTPTPLPSMGGIRISNVSSGSGFTAAVSASGTVYTWGRGDWGRLGHGDKEGSLVPKQVQALAGHRVLSVASGHSHCLAVTENSEIFSWGADTDGRCGHGSPGAQQMLPRRVDVLTGVRARSASAGVAHSLVVTEEGALYSFGYGFGGRLGHGIVADESFPRMVDELRLVRIFAAAAGGKHSLALAEDGSVFSWGGYDVGRLGLGRSGGSETLPQKVEALRGIKVCSVAARDFASFAVTATGELFTWGYGRAGRLGHGDTADQQAPRRIQALQGEWVVAVSAGFAHTVAVTRGGSVFGWGKAGVLGLQGNATVQGDVCVLSPSRYQQLACVRSPY